MGPWTFTPSFTVAGCGEFPFDMLRYDECWPADTASVAAIALDTSNLRARESRRCVKLVTHRRFGGHIARWASFGWKVISHDENGAPLHPDDAAAARSEWEAERAAS